MKDIVERLLTENTMHSYYDSPAIQVEAATEITRLRARVEVLREPLAVYVHAHQTGNSVPPHIEAAARAALKEARP
jgi:hypothetical protein